MQNSFENDLSHEEEIENFFNIDEEELTIPFDTREMNTERA